MRMLRALLVVALTVAIEVLAPVPAGAATITPTVFVDDLTVNGNCTLREALIAANTNAPVDGCAAGSGADVIQLQAGTYELTLQGFEDATAAGDLDIVSDVSIVGAGPGATTVAGAWAANTDRIFHILTTGTDGAINGITIRDGGGNQNAAGILVLGPDVSLQMAGVVLTRTRPPGTWGHCGTTEGQSLSGTRSSATTRPRTAAVPSPTRPER